MSFKTIAIVAYDENRGIGKLGDIPWRIAGEMKWLAQVTKAKEKSSSSDNVLIMGRHTWESLPKKPLPNRLNVVISKKYEHNFDGAIIYSSLESCLNDKDLLSNVEKVFIFGGAEIYKEGFRLGVVDKVIVTEIPGDYSCDKFFPEIPSGFKLSLREEVELGSVSLIRKHYVR